MWELQANQNQQEGEEDGGGVTDTEAELLAADQAHAQQQHAHAVDAHGQQQQQHRHGSSNGAASVSNGRLSVGGVAVGRLSRDGDRDAERSTASLDELDVARASAREGRTPPEALPSAAVSPAAGASVGVRTLMSRQEDAAA